MLFWPVDDNTGEHGFGLLCEVISGFHSHAKQASFHF